MTDMQKYALSNPLARASLDPAQPYGRLDPPWSIILTVNK